MPKALTGVLAALAAVVLTSCATRPPLIQPLSPAPFAGWSETYRLANESIEVIVAPALGRIVHIAPRGEAFSPTTSHDPKASATPDAAPSRDNVLRLDPALAGRVLDPAHPEAFVNVGGDWLWPVAQAQWTDIAGANWPPPPVLAERPWTALPWQSSDGTVNCLLKREYGVPVNVKASRLISLDAHAPLIRIIQKAERLDHAAVEPSGGVPITLWQVSQLDRPGRVFMPIDPESAFPFGYSILMGEEPAVERLGIHNGILVYDTAVGGMHKLGSDSRAAWIAAERDGVLIVERAVPSLILDNPCYPDKGCTVEMFSDTGMGYAEIETLSAERTLRPGDRMENTLVIELHPFPRGMTDGEAAERVRALAHH